MNQESLLRHVGDDLELLSDMLAMFRDNYPRQLERISNALSDRAAEELVEAAHQLRGSLCNFHATSAVEAAAMIEQAAASNRLDDAQPIYNELKDSIDELVEGITELIRQGQT